MKKFFFILSFFCSLCFAFKINSNVTALKLDNENLYIGTDGGEILLYHIKDKSLKELVSLPKINNYYANTPAKIYHIDSLNDTLLIISEGDFGTKNLNFYDGSLRTKKLEQESVKKIFFISKKLYLLALRGSTILLMDDNLKILKEFKFSHSSLNDIALSEDKTKLVAGFESGEVKLFSLEKWEVLKTYKNLHKDNVYQVDLKKDVILSCGTDRRVGVVKKGEESFLQKDFLIYTCALSPSGKFAAYSDNQSGISEVFDTQSLKSVAVFDSEKLMSEMIVFIDDENFILSGFGDSVELRSMNE